MPITYTEEKTFTQEQMEQLFLSVNWVSGQYPDRLHKALLHSSTVLTAWDGDRLVGLARALDDGELLAFIHYVLVHPDYQGRGIAGTLVEKLKERYQTYLYIDLMPDERKNAAFYERHGFRQMEDGVPMQLCSFPE